MGAHIRWVSPIAGDDYAEYRDADFLRAVELGDYASELASFWPSGGPSWDALAVTYDTDGRIRPGVILVEAKSHISEIYGIGCQANPASRDLIEKALAVAKQWCGASGDADWTGPLYQSANRLAHLYFIRERIKHTAWLVNLYFINDPIGPADQAAWEVELQKVKASLGLATTALPSVIELFLPALTSSEGYEPPEAGGDCQTKESESEALGDCPDELHASAHLPQGQRTDHTASGTFSVWADRWMAIAQYDGPWVPDVSQRFEQLARQWREPIPGLWQRGVDAQLLDSRYRRGDIDAPHRGEHAIEYDILCRHFDSVSCFGNKLLDGVNALPLVRDARGGRHANVEADLYLLTQCDGVYRLVLCEVKSESNTAWYAAIESIRQLRLLMSSTESRGVFARRNPSLCLPSDIPVTAIVLAPPSFYASHGKKANAVEPTLKLLARFTAEFGVDIRLAVWDSSLFEIKDWSTRAGWR